jgi:hypothetical protein
MRRVPLAAVALLATSPSLGAQASVPEAGSARSASVVLMCRLDVPALCAVRDVQPVSVRELGGGVHEVSFDVIVGSNTRWTLTVKPRPDADAALTVEVRNELGAWVPVLPERGPVTIVSGQASGDRHAERVVFRLRSGDPFAALRLIQFDVLPVTP